VKRRRPRLGQHFLTHAGIRERILDLLGAAPRDTWLEIGAGHGEMTKLLATSGGKVLAVETDPALVRQLQARFADTPKVRVFHADILKLSLAELAAPEPARFRVYGNLPYYITSPILQHLFSSLELIADIHVVVQREVAARLVAGPGRRDYGYFSAVTQFYTQPEILLGIRRWCG
jgi:16S rRNA (adenine1518-N6/adenine1519-N6)-dimethyltransferase